MRSGRRPSPELTRLLFVGMIKPMICPANGPTEGWHKKIRQRQDKQKADKAITTRTKSPMCSWWAKDETRDKDRAETKEVKTRTEH